MVIWKINSQESFKQKVAATLPAMDEEENKKEVEGEEIEEEGEEADKEEEKVEENQIRRKKKREIYNMM